ncbi:hypothetical protein J2X83_006055 [Brevibacillus nitrificans]|nr:hypothetical protein [Brevibacillus nitrificans]
MSFVKLNEPPYTERYVRWCERTGVSHSLLLDFVTLMLCHVKAMIYYFKFNPIPKSMSMYWLIMYLKIIFFLL